jgi:hypothetical protein
MEKLKGRNYKIVEPYKFYASFERLAEIYKNALNDAKISSNDALVRALFKYSGYRCSRTSPTNTLDNKIDSLIEKYRKLTRKTSHVDAIPPGPDLGIIAMLNVIRTIKFNLAGGSGKTMKRRRSHRHPKHYRKTRNVNRR